MNETVKVHFLTVCIVVVLEKVSLYRILAGDGQFQVSTPDDSADAFHVLDIKQRTNVGVLMKGPQSTQHWFQPASINISSSGCNFTLQSGLPETAREKNGR